MRLVLLAITLSFSMAANAQFFLSKQEAPKAPAATDPQQAPNNAPQTSEVPKRFPKQSKAEIEKGCKKVAKDEKDLKGCINYVQQHMDK